VIDVATGTGFWLNYVLERGAHAFGIDISAEMLAEASHKPALRNRLVLGDIVQLPFASDTANLAICSFAIGYVHSLAALLTEMARVARTIIVSDLHEHAADLGWRRGFECDGTAYQIESVIHTASELDTAAQHAKLLRQWRVAACFDEPEREIFARAGKPTAFEQFRNTPAILCTCWSTT
jgi:ubiquinone/menaquinone biosynthesis C-methylase UbiE